MTSPYKVPVAIVLIAGLAMGTTACDERESGEGVPVTHAAISQSAGDNLRNTAGGMSDAGGFLDEMSISQLLEDQMTCTPSESENTPIDPVTGEPVEGWTEPGQDGCLSAEQLDFDLDQILDDLASALQNEILVEDNVIARTNTRVTYAVPGDVMCDEDSDCGPGLELAIAVSSPNEGDLLLEILIGSQQINPIDVRLYHNQLGLTLDLAELKRALVAIAAEQGETIDLPEVLQGQIAIDLIKAGGARYSVEVAIERKIEILSMDLEQPISLTIDEARPAFRAVLDGDQRTLTLESDMGPIDARIPAGLFFGGTQSCTTFQHDDGSIETYCESGSADIEGELQIHLAGGSMSVTLDGDDDTVRIDNIGLGNDTTTIAIDGQQIVGLDLNKNHGRRLSAEISGWAEGLEIAVSPAFELELDLATHHIAGDTEVADWTLDEQLRLTLDGADNPTVRLNQTTGDLVVVEGRLELSSSTLGEVYSVEAGMCLMETEGDEGDHPFANSATGSCR